MEDVLTSERARRLAARLDLDVDRIPICHACLSFVAFALDKGDEREARSWTLRMTPVLWGEGLALPLRLAVERARAEGVPDAGAALADLLHAGPRTTIARAAVRRLAEQLCERMVRADELARPPATGRKLVKATPIQ